MIFNGFVGTSIGFKNIASKIAYDLRLWLDSKSEQYASQQSKSLDNDHAQYVEDTTLINHQASATIKTANSNPSSVEAANDDHDHDQLKHEITVTTGTVEIEKTDKKLLKGEGNIDELQLKGDNDLTGGQQQSNRRNSKSSSSRNRSNIKLGYNNIIASLLRTTTL